MEPDTDSARGLQQQMFGQLESKAVFRRAMDCAFQYMDGLELRPVFPAQKDRDGLAAFDQPMPEEPGDAEGIIQLLHQHGSPATVAQTGGRYFGFVNGGAIPVAVAAKWLSSVWDQNPALYLISPTVAKLETVCEKWLVDLLGLPQGAAMGLVSGSSLAILCGLAAGRNHLLQQAGWDVHERGLFGAPRLRVLVGEQAHATVFRALSLLGLGGESVERVPVDRQGGMDPSKLSRLDQRCLVVAQAGNVNTGAFDPLEEICALTKPAGAWLHVDGAFGLWAAATRKRRHLVIGLEKADSWSVDGHKTLNTPYDCGMVFCADREILVAAMQTSASYIPYGQNRDNMLYTPDMSRRSRAVELWATLKFLGQRGVSHLVDGLCDHAALLANLLQAAGFRILNEVVFNQVLVACATPEETSRTLAAIQQSGQCWAGGAQWQHEPAIRLSVCSWATTQADLERTVDAFMKARGQAGVANNAAAQAQLS